jgi:hypothetical protein
MSAKIIQFPDRKSELERIKGLEEWVEMQFWMYEQDLMDHQKYFGSAQDASYVSNGDQSDGPSQI